MPVAAAVAGSVVSGLMSGGGGSSSGGVGNVAGGAAYDPYAANRGKAASALDALIYGTGSTSGTPVGTSSSGQTYQQYLQSMPSQPSGGSGHMSMAGWVQDSYGSYNTVSGGGGGTAMSEAQWNQQNPGSAGTSGTSPTDMIKNMPGYQFGMNAGTDTLNRTMAGTGQSQSGAQQVALSEFGQQYAGSFYDKMVAQLSSMAGVGQGTTNVTPQNQLNQNQSNLQASSMGSAVSAGVTGLYNAYNNNQIQATNGSGLSNSVY